MAKQTKVALLREVTHKTTESQPDKKKVMKILKGAESKMNKADDATVKLALEQLIDILNEMLLDEVKVCNTEYKKVISLLGEFDASLKYE